MGFLLRGVVGGWAGGSVSDRRFMALPCGGSGLRDGGAGFFCRHYLMGIIVQGFSVERYD